MRARASAALAAAALFGSGLAPTLTRAAPAPARVVVLAPHIEGDATDAAAVGIDTALREGLGRGDVQVVTSTVRAAECVDAGCRAAAMRDADARALVVVHVVSVRRDYDVTMTLVDGEGEEVARVERRCELCGVTELAEHVDAQAATLLARLRTPQAAPATLTVRSTPSGAIVQLDERVVGETPLERKVELGTHVLRLSLRGYVDEQRRFDALAGVHEAIAFDLVPVPDDARRRRLRAGGFASLVIGTAATAAGLTLIGLHGRANRPRCNGANVDADGDCKYLYDTRIPGIVVTSVGVAAIATGIALLVVSSKKKKNAR